MHFYTINEKLIKMKLISRLIIIAFLFAGNHISAQIDLDLSSPWIKFDDKETKNEGMFEFRLNKPVNQDVHVHGFKMEIKLEKIKPQNGIESLSGNGSELFTWQYDEESNSFIGEQVKEITGFLFSGNFKVEFVKDGDSPKDDPQNGFNATISGIEKDFDVVEKNNFLSLYTWTVEE